jgi:mitogen-activated protein kinase kinase 1
VRCAESLIIVFRERISGQPYSFSSDIWSFGLVVLACALGRYPYATELGYWALLNAIQQQPAPVLPTSPPIAGGSGGVFSQPLSDLVAAALNKDVSTRPSAAELLRHGAFEPIRRASELVIEPHDDLPYEIDG